VLLAGAEARGRLHLRRILAGSTGIEIVGHARPGSAIEESMRRCGVDVVLIDPSENTPAAEEAVHAAQRLHLRTLVLVIDTGTGTRARFGRCPTLARPAALDDESANTAFGVALRRKLMTYGHPVTPAPTATPSVATTLRTGMLLRPELIAIGSSTGGPQALPEVLSGLAGRVRQPIVITQHMPAAFTNMLAVHLTRYTTNPTVEATHGQQLMPGHVYLAPGGRHLLIERKNDKLVCVLDDGPPEHFCKPAVDPMLRSITTVLGGRALAVILTGMGHDGLAGCRGLVAAGGAVLAQNEATSVVWGMPGAVAQAGLCRAVLPLNRIAEEIIILAGMQP
jgi:two-component system, chemotaxis family, protein-glutamate methylesterase/glutaminase